MNNDLLKYIYDKLIQANLADPSEIKGCSILELKNIEAEFGLTLPTLYRNFLLRFGYKAGNFFLGTDIFYNSLFGLKNVAEELLKENTPEYVLPPSAFVFASHQGYQFMYFDLSKNVDDPSVYYYMEGMDKPEKRWEHFSDFLKVSLKQHILSYKKIK